jgi:hypothetical protein
MDISKVPFEIVFRMPVAEIVPAPFNPATRTEPRNLKRLLNLIRDKGFRFPVYLSRDGVLGDGHRRVACAKIIGLADVPAMRFDLSADELFEMNDGMKTITDAQLLDAYRRGFRRIRQSKLDRIHSLRDLVGEDGITRLADKGVSIHILSMARMVANYCDNDDHRFLARCIWWLVDYNQQFAARSAIREMIDPDVLEMAIETGRKLSKSWEAQ